MFDRWRQAKNEVDDLNLIPIMNLMMTLIPFLLMGAAFYHIGVIPSSLPTHVPQGNPHPDKTKTVTLNLQVLPDKLELSATGNNIPDSELSDMSPRGPQEERRLRPQGPPGAAHPDQGPVPQERHRHRAPRRRHLLQLPGGGPRHHP